MKPLDGDPATLGWLETVLHQLDGDEAFRVAPPLRTTTGQLSVDGWTAWRFEPGEHRDDAWLEVIATGQALHRALSEYAKPSFLELRSDPWAIADRVAWGELPGDDWVHVPGLGDLFTSLRPIFHRPQLIHGDLTHNVLFADALPPLVIDLSPYWRPVLSATAIVVADALVFGTAGPSLLTSIRTGAVFGQHLVRALIFRMVTDHLRDNLTNDLVDRYRPVVRTAVELASRT